jgi:ribonuclease BN (tRNA processing enzyme)
MTGCYMSVINFAKDTDILIHDTQYTTEEYFSQKMVVQGFGHSTYDMAIENAIKSNVKKTLYCTHFNPTHSDDKLDEIQGYVNTVKAIGDTLKSHEFDINLAKEGLVFEV